MNAFRRCYLYALALTSISLALLAPGPVTAATKTINLDGRSANGAESAVELNIQATYPAKVQNKITNRAVGDAYRFTWPSAGPGGFSSQLAGGTTAGVGAIWTWQTSQTIYSFTGNSCTSDVCFTRVSGPDPAPTNSPAWAVPGRTLTPNATTVSSASLTSSLITFFSPPQTLVTATSSVAPLLSGQFAYTTTYTNTSGASVVVDVPPAPIGCCEYPDQLHCDGTCVDYLWDGANCGGCGVDCNDVCQEGFEGEGKGPYCYQGECYCGAGESAPLGDAGGGASPRPSSGLLAPADDVIVGAQPLGNVVAAPLCETPGYQTILAPDESIAECSTSGFLPKEIAGVLTVCGDSIPDGDPTCGGGEAASEGTFMQFVPDPSRPFPTSGVLLSPYQVTVSDTSGDGVLQPGESASIYVSVINLGPATLQNASAELVSPDIDLTDDGVVNLESVSITQAVSPYAPDIVGLAPAPGGDCDGPFAPIVPSTNTLAFVVSVPPGNTGDVARPFELVFTGTEAFAPSSISVPLSLGIGSAEVDTDGDGLPDLRDRCPDSILDPTVVVPSAAPGVPDPTGTVLPCDSRVPNLLLADGCTISDEVAACDAATRNKGQFAKCVKGLTKSLRRAGILTEKQRKAIDKCAKKYKKRDVRAAGGGSSSGAHDL